MDPASKSRISELLAAPELATKLPTDEVPALLVQIASLQAILLSRLLSAPANGATHPPDNVGPVNLSIGEAARRLGVSRSWLYRHHRDLPYTVRLGRRLLFSAAGIANSNTRPGRRPGRAG